MGGGERTTGSDGEPQNQPHILGKVVVHKERQTFQGSRGAVDDAIPGNCDDNSALGDRTIHRREQGLVYLERQGVRPRSPDFLCMAIKSQR